MTAVSAVMTRGVRFLAPSDTVAQAAQAMDEINVGVIPVCEGGNVVGMVTDRDIVVRSVALGMDAGKQKLSEVMSTSVRTAQEDEDVDHVLAKMAQAQIRRMPVLDGEGVVVGIISLGDIATKDPLDRGELASSLSEISTPAAPDRISHA